MCHGIGKVGLFHPIDPLRLSKNGKLAASGKVGMALPVSEGYHSLNQIGSPGCRCMMVIKGGSSPCAKQPRWVAAAVSAAKSMIVP